MLGSTQCIVRPIARLEAPRHRPRMPQLGAHALVRASYLITNIERRVERGEISSADAKALLHELSALLARIAAARSDSSREGIKGEAT